MGTNSLSFGLFPKARQRVLALFFNQPQRTFYTNEIIKLTNCGTGVIQRELSKLSTMGLITVQIVGNQKQYQANSASPIYHELRGLVLKTFGLANILSDSLFDLKEQIHIAFIFGSIAKQTDNVNSDIDLMVITDHLSYIDIFSHLESISNELGKKINPTIYSKKQFVHKLKEKNNFILQVLEQPKIFLIGSENELRTIK
jgi:predicted nucleotidyltransferase